MTNSPSHLLSVNDFSRDDVMAIFKKASSFKKSLPTVKPSPKILMNAFFENSTRTRCSFETAAYRLGMHVINISETGSSAAKGESLTDTILTLCAMQPSGIVLRHSMAGAAELAASVSGKIPIINAGDGSHEHPTQALLDVFTILQHKKTLKGLHVGIVGDLAHSRLARSNMLLLHTLGAKVTVCGPRTMIPAGIENYGVSVTTDLDALIPKLDVIMMLRIQLERAAGGSIPSTGDYARLYQLNARRLSLAPEMLVMHQGPMNRGVEITDDVADGPQSVIREMVANGVFIRMAILDHIL